jgi:hypothetical protein
MRLVSRAYLWAFWASISVIGIKTTPPCGLKWPEGDIGYEESILSNRCPAILLILPACSGRQTVFPQAVACFSYPYCPGALIENFERGASHTTVMLIYYE